MHDNITHLHNITPERLKAEILNGVREMLSEFIQESNSEDKLLTRKEVAILLSISLPTLRAYVKRGLLKEHRIGARVLYKKSEVVDSFSK
nr:helix-turn-helix domain-containing protein [uncultured Psychroserpens sp.]